jgi:hypothetical protein
VAANAKVLVIGISALSTVVGRIVGDLLVTRQRAGKASAALDRVAGSPAPS